MPELNNLYFPFPTLDFLAEKMIRVVNSSLSNSFFTLFFKQVNTYPGWGISKPFLPPFSYNFDSFLKKPHCQLNRGTKISIGIQIPIKCKSILIFLVKLRSKYRLKAKLIRVFFKALHLWNGYQHAVIKGISITYISIAAQLFFDSINSHFTRFLAV